ncbi:aryl hydrocarbon receptor-like [Limulus polyphemus]|uniref:Aryl hydrocarbon receptor-like n=1 Tax=Limulus polyphemus TaxID=6850 RepID=A0ABM1SNR2_LIMPO|nr:aryl hydrocarbon receptor-like [Limulus polyphemus]
MNHLSTMYATKRRRRNSKSVRVPPKDGQTKSNPSKRHRERLNAELENIASLLPFEQNVLSKLDKLSILRLSVSYLRTKSYFQAASLLLKERQGQEPGHKPRELLYQESLLEGNMILQALNGFLLILTCEGEVFYASHTVETYLGFHQSDICHQSVYELVHSEDREELQRHLMWNSRLSADHSGLSLQEILSSAKHLEDLERNFTVRFRCLLDNTSGFLRLDIRGRIKILHGQHHKTEDPPLALFAVCTPFGPPSLLEMPHKESMFKSKHKLDLSLVSMDQRGKQLLGYADTELANKGGYDLVHYDDLAYVANAHQELLKTGASGLIAYRLVKKDGKWQWLQTSARLVYKNSKPDFILCTHRPLMEEEGRDLLGKRTMDFKVTYLDGGLNAITDRSGLLSDSDFVLRCQRTRKYKSQIRDLLSTCRKWKVPHNPYLEEPSYNVYPYPTDNVNGLAPYAAAAMPQNIFSSIDNSRFLSPENYLHYRHLGGCYPEYSHHAAQYTSNGFLDMSSAAARTCFPTAYPDGSQLAKDNKIYHCQLDATKFNGEAPHLVQQMGAKPSCCEGYPQTNDPSAQLRGCLMSASSGGIQPLLSSLERDPAKIGNLNFGLSGVPVSVGTDCINVIRPKTTTVHNHLRDSQQFSKDSVKIDNEPLQPSSFSAFTNDTRQSVLMWGNSFPRSCGGHNSGARSSLFDGKFPSYINHMEGMGKTTEMITNGSAACKWSNSPSISRSSSPNKNSSPCTTKTMTPVHYGGTAMSVYGAEMGQEAWTVEHLSPWRPHLPSLG